jgi:S-adenosylmethionine-dependent methyltransferase
MVLRRIQSKIYSILHPAPSAPSGLQQNHRSLDAAALAAVERSIRKNYHRGWRSEASYTPSAYQADLVDHLHNRIKDDRARIVPWLNNVRPLNGLRVLELGCGTGSSTVAIAEQGAKITGIDIDEDALLVARDRCAAYKVDASFESVNGCDLLKKFGSEKFDLIVYFACLEHMTIPERLQSLQQAWTMLPQKGLLAIVETPNRLWYYDEHTARLPFFHWLPDELAFAYSRFSKRDNFKDLYKIYDEDSKMHFLRRGRGMSFHEIDLAIAPIDTLSIASALSDSRRLARWTSLDNRTYKSTMQKLFPGIHSGFLDEYLDIVLVKD